jgi:hypothetical protein
VRPEVLIGMSIKVTVLRDAKTCSMIHINASVFHPEDVCSTFPLSGGTHLPYHTAAYYPNHEYFNIVLKFLREPRF